MNVVLLNSPREQSHDVMDLCEEFITQWEKESNKKSKAPRDYNDARRRIIDGVFSTMNNFPSPNVFEINGHACVSLKQTIRILMGHGAQIQFAWDGHHLNREGLNKSKAAQSAILEITKGFEDMGLQQKDYIKYKIGLLYYWSDSWLQSFVKQKDNSIWAITVTIGNIKIVLAIGRSGQDHTAVIDYFHQEIAEMRMGFSSYDGHTNEIVKVAFNLLYHSADRPERKEITHTRKEGNYGKVSNYSTQVSTTKLPACPDCFQKLVQNVLRGRSDAPKCKKCFCWTFDDVSEEQKIFDVPSDYPPYTIIEGQHPPPGRVPGATKIGPVRLSSKWLIQACTFGYECIRQEKWNRAQFRSYMRTCCVNEALTEKILFAAEFAAKADTYEGNVDEVLPKIWYLFNCFARSIFPDMPMHLIAHGLGDDVIHFFEAILKCFRRDAAFTTFVNNILSEISQWGLEWCKLKSYPKSAWVGENIMGYMRLISYLYGMYLVNYPFPEEKGAQITTHMLRMLNALQSMLSLLMTRKDQTPSMVLDHIKVFMSTFHHCDDECASLKMDDEQTSKGGKKSKRKKVTDMLTDDEVLAVLTFMDIRPVHGRNDLRNVINEKKPSDLKAFLKDKELDTKGNKNQLQKRLFAFITKRSFEDVAEGVQSSKTVAVEQEEMEIDHLQTNLLPDDRDGTTKSPRKFAWCKGGNLSLLANYIEQYHDLGPLRDIWYALGVCHPVSLKCIFNYHLSCYFP